MKCLNNVQHHIWELGIGKWETLVGMINKEYGEIWRFHGSKSEMIWLDGNDMILTMRSYNILQRLEKLSLDSNENEYQ
jgi:hypothetical protein